MTKSQETVGGRISEKDIYSEVVSWFFFLSLDQIEKCSLLRELFCVDAITDFSIGRSI